MTIQGVYDGIKTQLDTIDGLVAFAYQPGQAVFPCAFPVLPEVDYHRAMQGGLREVNLDVALLVASLEQESRQTNLLAFIEPTGTSSIHAALIDSTLGGHAKDVFVSAFTPFGVDDLAALQAIGGTFRVRVLLA